MSTVPLVATILLRESDRAYVLAEALATKGIEALVLESSEELRRILTGRRVDLVVIEHHLEGFLTGLEIIEKLQEDLLHPELILVGELLPHEQDEADRLGVKSTVLAGDLTELMRTILSRLTVAGAPQLTIPARAKHLAQKADVVRPLPQLLTKLCSYLHNETAPLAVLANDISLDPRVTAEVLKVANSAALGLARKVTNVQHAVTLLGVKRTVATVLATGVFRAQSELLRSLSPDFRRWYQTRGVLIAGTAATFAERLEGVSPDTAHVLGLLQDLGVLILAKAEPRSYEQMLRRSNTVGQLRLECLERDEYGVTHAEVSAALLEKWEIPSSLVAMVLDHHPPERRTDFSQAERSFLHAMRVAEAVANLANAAGPHRHRALQELLLRYGPARADECRACIATGIAKAVEYSKLFSIPAPDDTVVDTLLKEVSREFDVDRSPEMVPQSETDEPPLPQAPAPVNRVFPRSRESPSEDPRSSSDVTPRGPKVLVVDDEPAIVRMIDRLLTPSGYGVIACTDPARVPDLARDVDFILCDVHLGDVRGIDVIRGLRESGVAAPVLMISGDRTRSTVIECIEIGIVDYIVKPFTRAILLEKLKKHTLAPQGALVPC